MKHTVTFQVDDKLLQTFLNDVNSANYENASISTDYKVRDMTDVDLAEVLDRIGLLMKGEIQMRGDDSEFNTHRIYEGIFEFTDWED